MFYETSRNEKSTKGILFATKNDITTRSMIKSKLVQLISRQESVFAQDEQIKTMIVRA